MFTLYIILHTNYVYIYSKLNLFEFLKNYHSSKLVTRLGGTSNLTFLFIHFYDLVDILQQYVISIKWQSVGVHNVFLRFSTSYNTWYFFVKQNLGFLSLFTLRNVRNTFLTIFRITVTWSWHSTVWRTKLWRPLWISTWTNRRCYCRVHGKILCSIHLRNPATPPTSP